MAALIVGASAAAGCGSSAGSKAAGSASPKPGEASVSVAVLYRPPKQAAVSWLVAINHKDRAAVLAHFERLSLTKLEEESLEEEQKALDNAEEGALK